MCCCKKCFQLAPTTVGAVAGIYTLDTVDGESVWFAPDGRRVTDSDLLTELTSLTDTEAKQEATLSQCKDNCYLEDVYKIDIGTPGVNLQFWQDNALPFDNDLDVTFSGAPDLNCLPTHPNAPDLEVVDNDWNHIDSTFGFGGAGAPPSQAKGWSWVIIPEKVLLRDNNAAVESARLYLGKCGEKAKPFTEWSNSATGDSPFAEVQPGLYLLGFILSDPSANSGIDLEFSVDGGQTYSNFPDSWISADQPAITCEKVEICTKSNTIRLLDGTDIEIDGINYAFCSPCSECCSADSSSSSSEDETDIELVVESGTGNIPAGFKSVTINNLTEVTTINGGFQLGTGTRLDSISFSTDRGNDQNETLPAYTLSGGTWQWIGHKE